MNNSEPFKVFVAAQPAASSRSGISAAAVQSGANVTIPENLLSASIMLSNALATSADAAAVLSALFSASPSTSPVIAPAVSPYVPNGIGSTFATARIGSPVLVPADRNLDGLGDLTQFRPLTALGSSPLFAFNTNGSNTPVQSTPLGVTHVRAVWFVNKDQAGSIVATGGPLAEFCGSVAFADIVTLNARSVIKQSTGGNSYSDLIRVQRVTSQSQYDDGSYLVDLNSNGDGLIVEQVTNNQAIDPTGANRHMRGHTLRMSSKQGGAVRGLINGDVMISSSTSIGMKYGHFEQGVTTVNSASAEIGNNIYYMRGDQTLGVDDPVNTQPLVVTFNDDGDKFLHGNISWVHDVTFAYLPAWSYPYSYKDNFTCDYPQSVTFERVHRMYYVASDAKYTCIMGSTQAQTAAQLAASDNSYLTFNAYSHLASMHSLWSMGESNGTFGGRWMISAALGNLAASAVLISLGLLATGSSAANFSWQGTTGTRYYKATFYQDKVRRAGVTGSEISFAVVNGAQSLPLMRLAAQCRGQQGFVHLEAGAASGSYTRSVDIPVLAGGVLVDNGNDVNGWAWATKAASDIETANQNILGGIEIVPGKFDALSDAYGHFKGWLSSSSLPTVGGWRKGDELELITPANEAGVTWLLGYRRITDCLSTATSNILGTDWIAIRTPQ